MAKVQIYGEIVPFQDEWIIENGYCNLAHVTKQLEAAEGEDIEVAINSPGGDVDEGFAIYSALRRYAKDNKASVTSRADGRVASIATVIFLAGDKRIGNEYIEPFVHNARWFQDGDAEALKKASVILEDANEKMAKFYAEHTNLTYEEARALMDEETFITPQEALDMRFFTEIEEIMRPVALERFSKKSKHQNIKKMSDKKTEKGLLEHLKAFFKTEGSIKNLEVMTSTSETLMFPDLEEGQEPKVGDKAEVDGKAAEGRITIQDGTTYVFVAGVLEEIIPAEEEEEDDEAMAALKAENEELKKQIAAQAKQSEAQAKQIESIAAKQKEADKRWEGLKNTISNYQVDGKENTRKAASEGTEVKGLAAAVAKLKKVS